MDIENVETIIKKSHGIFNDDDFRVKNGILANTLTILQQCSTLNEYVNKYIPNSNKILSPYEFKRFIFGQDGTNNAYDVIKKKESDVLSTIIISTPLTNYLIKLVNDIKKTKILLEIYINSTDKNNFISNLYEFNKNNLYEQTIYFNCSNATEFLFYYDNSKKFDYEGNPQRRPEKEITGNNLKDMVLRKIAEKYGNDYDELVVGINYYMIEENGIDIMDLGKLISKKKELYYGFELGEQKNDTHILKFDNFEINTLGDNNKYINIFFKDDYRYPFLTTENLEKMLNENNFSSNNIQDSATF